MRAARARLARAVALGLVLGAAGRARAEPGGDADEVVVLGSAPSSGFVGKASIGDAPREITDASSLLESVPGVHVRRSGADDGFATLSIRGSTSSEVAILFAGVPLTGAADPSLDLSTLPLWPGARVRVYRSFAPAALGPGSLGGTLVLEPPRPSDPEGSETWAAVGSFGEARLRVADVRALGDGGARVVTALSASRADGDFTFYDSFVGACLYTSSPACFRPRQNDGHADVNGLVSLALPAGPRGTLQVTALLQARQQGIAGGVEEPTPFATLRSTRALASVELTEAAGAGAWSARGWARRDELVVADRDGPEDLLPLRSDDVIAALGLSGGWRGAVARGLVVEARADTSAEGNEPGIAVGATTAPVQATRAAVGGGADADWRVAGPLRLGASGRLDVDSDRVSLAPAGAPPGTEVRPTGHLGAEVQAGPAVLSAHCGAIARPPSFLELYGSAGGVLPAPSLVGESAWTVDAGGRVTTRGGGPVRAQVELVGFATWAKDLITFVPRGFEQLLQAENIGAARLFGVEASALARAHGFDARAAYTGMRTLDDSQATEENGALVTPPLPGRPAHDFVGDVGYTLGPARVRYGVDVLTGEFADTVGAIPIPARVLQSTGARLDVPGVRGLRVAVEVRNLFDVRTATYPGFVAAAILPIGDQYDYPLPGRSVLVTARWAVGGAGVLRER